MYTIDLLGGEAVPIRSRPGWIAFVCMLIAVPLLVGVVLVGIHMDRQVTVSIQTQQLTRLEGVLKTLTSAMEKKKALEEQRAATIGLLVDIGKALGRHTQWSPVLETVTESLPEALVLTNLSARQEFVSRKVPSKENPDQTVTVSVPMRSLSISVWGHDGGTTYRAVRQLQDRLRSSETLASRLDTITVSQESGPFDGQPGVRYELNCTFKPEVQ